MYPTVDITLRWCKTTRDPNLPTVITCALCKHHSILFCSELQCSWSAELQVLLLTPTISKYIRLLNHEWHTAQSHMFRIKVHCTVIWNTAHRSSTQATYTIGSGTTMQENQPGAQIAAKHNIFTRMHGAIYVMNLFGAGRKQSRGLPRDS